MPVAGRSYARIYRTTGRGDIHDFLLNAFEQSGGRVLYVSSPLQAPVYFGVHAPSGERIDDEHRLQIRYGAESTWAGDHPLGRDIATVDTTVVLGVHLDAQVLIGPDPNLYDPLPMGISVEFKDEPVPAAQDGMARVRA